MSAPGLMDDKLTWQTYSGKWTVIHTPQGSYAATRAAAMLREAEHAADTLTQLLKPANERLATRIDIYLADPTVELSGGRYDHSPPVGAVGSDVVIRAIQPEDPDDLLVRPLTHLLAARWFGPDAAAAVLFLDGIAGVAAARIGGQPAIQETHDWVRAELAAGHPVSVVSHLPQEPTPAAGPTDGAVNDYVATSFVAYLIDGFGTDPLHHVLAMYDPDRRDQACVAAYQRPLGVLEELWLASFRRSSSGGAAFGSFFHHVGPLIKPYWGRQVEIFAYMLVGLVYTLALPLSTKYLFDTVIPRGDPGTLGIFILGLFGLYVLNALVGMRRAYVTSWVNQRVLIGLQERVFTHLQDLSHDFYATAKIGDLMSRLTNDVQVIQQAMAQVAGNGVYMALRAIAAALAMLALDLILGAAILLIVPLFAVGYFVLRSRIQQASHERQQRTGEATTTVQENLSSYGVIRAFGMEKREIVSYHARLMTLFRVTLRLITLSALFQLSTSLAVTMGQLIVLGGGGYFVIQGQVSLGTLVAFIGLIPTLIQPVSALSGISQTVEKASGAMDRVTEVLDEPVAVADKPGALALPPLAREIRLEHVAFGYGGDMPILRDLDFAIPAGANVAIVGPSGSGKSTVVNLLLRFWDPEQGHVLFDGHDLRDVAIASLRDQVGVVFQDTFIFDTTIRENIAIGWPEASDAEIAAAAKAARLDGYIDSLPARYDTVLGERGVRMSGGQRQRLAIARALLRDPRVLILDEATSALDAQTESEILDTLAAFTQGRTTISITHRLTSAVTMDRIFVLDQGQLVEQGTHAELVKSGGLYQRLYEEQTGVVAPGRGAPVTVEAARLRAIPLLAGLTGETLTTVADRLMVERYASDEDVVHQGEPGDKLYIIDKGQVEVVLTTGRRERRVNVLNEGDYFGEMALLTDQPRAATVRATMPARLYSLSRADFATLFDHEPAVRQAVSETVSTRQRALAAAASRTAASGIAPRAPAGQEGRDVSSPDSSMVAPETASAETIGQLRPVGGLIGTDLIVLPLAHPFRIGREAQSDLQLFDSRVSRRHATIDYTSGEFVLTDLNSANGVYVNGGRIAGTTVLHDGDRIEIGNLKTISFTFELVRAPHPADRR